MLKKLQFRALICILLYLSIILFISSCEKQIRIPDPINVPSVEPTIKIPLNAGLYLSQDFRNANYTATYAGKYFWQNVFVGDILYKISKEIIENIFQNTIMLDSIEDTPDLSSKRYDVVIAPEVVNLAYYTKARGLSVYCIVQTTIKWKIVNPEGKDIYIAPIKGDEVNSKLKKIKDHGECIKRSIESHFQRAQEDIYSSGWWKKQWWKRESNLEKRRTVARETPMIKEKLIPADAETPNVDWQHLRKEQLPSPPIEQAKPVTLSVYSQLRLPKYEISRQVPDPSPEMMALPGRWQGIWDMTGTPSALIIHKIEGRKVNLIYAWGFCGPMKERQPSHVEITGNLAGPEPVIKFQYANARYTFTLEEGKLKGLQEQPDMAANSITMVKVE